MPYAQERKQDRQQQGVMWAWAEQLLKEKTESDWQIAVLSHNKMQTTFDVM